MKESAERSPGLSAGPPEPSQHAQPRLPRALVITRNLPPLVGGMERLIWHVIDELRAEYAVHVIGPRGCARHLPSDVTATEVPIAPMSSYLFRTAIASLSSALRMRPSVVFAGSGLAAPFALLASRIIRSRCAVYLHGLDMEADHFAYRYLWRPLFRWFDRVFVNSHHSLALARALKIRNDRIAVLYPGVTLPDRSLATQLRSNFRATHDLGDSPVMLYVGRITPRKGLAAFTKSVFPQIAAVFPNAKLVVVGTEPSHSILGNRGELAETKAALTQSNLSGNAIFLGEIAQADPKLSAAYFAADVLVFPVQRRKNDNEGFGMVAIEAAAHGLPTVAYDVGGVSDAVRPGISGRLIPEGNERLFANAVIEFLGRRTEFDVNKCTEFASELSWPVFGAALRRGLDP